VWGHEPPSGTSQEGQQVALDERLRRGSRGRGRAHGEEKGLLGGETLHLAGVAGGGAPLEGLGRGSAAPRGVAGAAGREAHPAVAVAAEGDREARWRGRGQRHGGRHA
jgi:hypothetical protein